MRYNLDYLQTNLIIIAEYENGLSSKGIPFDFAVSINRLKLRRIIPPNIVRITLRFLLAKFLRLLEGHLLFVFDINLLVRLVAPSTILI